MPTIDSINESCKELILLIESNRDSVERLLTESDLNLQMIESINRDNISTEISNRGEDCISCIGPLNQIDGCCIDYDTVAEASNTALVNALSPVIDAYVNDTLVDINNLYPSIVGFSTEVPNYAGNLLLSNWRSVKSFLHGQKPRVLVTSQVEYMKSITEAIEENHIQYVLTGGELGILFQVADGYSPVSHGNTVQSDYLNDVKIKRAQNILDKNRENIFYPQDVAIDIEGNRSEFYITASPFKSRIVDIAEGTIDKYTSIISSANSVLLSGCIGDTSDKISTKGTIKILDEASDLDNTIGAGRRLAAICEQNDVDGFNHFVSRKVYIPDIIGGSKITGVTSLMKDSYTTAQGQQL
jgi:phosphoglycerate kinase